MIDISFMLPTARATEHPDVLKSCIEGINREHSGLNHEILVYSRERVEGENVKWIEEEGQKGPIYGFNLLASEFAQGDYLVVITDDHLFVNSVSLCIDNIENTFTNRKYKIGGLLPEGDTCCLPQKGQRMGTPPGIMEVDIPRIPFLRFPVVRKDTFKLLGGYIFHPDLFYHAGDMWLGYYLYMNGEPTIEGPTRITPIKQLKNSDYEGSDCDIVHELIKRHVAGQTEYVSGRARK